MTTEQDMNAIELPNLTETEELHVALKIMRGKRSVRKFVLEHGFDVLENVKNVVDFVVEEHLEEEKRQDEVRKNHEAAIAQAAQGYVDAMKSAGIEVSIDDALEALTLQAPANVTPRKSVRKPTNSKPRAPRKEYKFLIGGEIITRPFARPSKELKDEMDTNDYAEQYMLLAEESVDEFLNDIQTQPQYKNKIEDIKSFFKKKLSSSQIEDKSPIEPKIEVVLLLDVDTAKEKFNIEMTENFEYEGTIEDLSTEQEKLLIAISSDDTVEGGIDALEALD